MKDLSLDEDRYNVILSDVLKGKNLEVHLREIERSIEAVDKFIGLANLQQGDTKEYETLKNQLYYLKYEILERL